MGAPRRIVLWRHGRTAWNADGRFQGQLDPPLDEVGVAQADAAVGVLRELPPTAVISSDLERAWRTGSALAARCGLPLRGDPRLREIDLGDWQGLTRPEARARFPEEYAAWQQGGDVRRGDGETYGEVGRRAAEALLERLDSVAPGGVLVAVTHGGTARAAMGVLTELEVTSWWRLGPLGNARWSVLVENRRGWQIEEHNAGSPPAEATGDDAR